MEVRLTRIIQVGIGLLALSPLLWPGAAAYPRQDPSPAPTTSELEIVRLSPGQTRQGEAQQAVPFLLSVAAGHAIRLEVGGANLRIALRDGDLTQVWEKWDYPCERATPLPIRWVARSGEGLTVTLEPLELEAVPSYVLRWTSSRQATAQDQQWVQVRDGVDRAERALQASQLQAARTHAGEAVALLEPLRASEPILAGRLLEQLANAFWIDDWTLTRDLFERAAEVRERAQGPKHPCLADALSSRAILLKEHGVWEEAQELETRALEIRTEGLGPSHPDSGLSHYNMGTILEAQAHFQESLSHFQRALEIFETSPAHQGQVPTVLYSIGEVLRSLQQYDRARQHFNQALALARQRLPQDDGVLPRIMTSLAGSHRDRGELQQAEQWARRSLEAKQAAGADPGSLANGLLNLAEILRLQARYEEAEPLYLEALETARSWMEVASPELVWFVNQTAKFYQVTGRAQRARELYRQAVEILRTRTAHPLLAQTLHDLGQLELAAGDPAAAREHLLEALRIREAVYGSGHPESAATRVQLARAYDRLPGSPPIEPLLNRSLADLQDSQVDPESELDGLELRARLLRQQGRAEEARADLLSALDLVEKLRPIRGGGDVSRVALIGEHLLAFQRLTAWYLEDGKPARAIETLERQRSRVFLDRLSLSGLQWTTGIPEGVLEPLLERESKLKEEISGCQQQIRRLLEERGSRDEVRRWGQRLDQALTGFRRIQEEIREASPLWKAGLANATRIASLAEIQRELLETRELLLIYQVSAEGSILALIPPAPAPLRFWHLSLDDSTAPPLGLQPGALTSAQLEEVLLGRGGASLLRQLGDPQSALGESAGVPGYEAGPLLTQLSALFRILIPGEAWREIRESEEIVIVPDGPLHYLPFEALVIEPAGDTASAGFWLDRGPRLHYAPSASVLRALAGRAAGRPAPTEPPTILSVSNPAYSSRAGGSQSSPEVAKPGRVEAAARQRYLALGGELQALPGTAQETQALVEAFGREQVRVLQGSEATEAMVRESVGAKRLLHLATHGIVGSSDADLLASLALSPETADTASSNDGFLQLFEIYQLQLDADLTVLSACETNLGRRLAGEGVFALSGGFLTAGSSRVLANQWRVDDDASAWLIGAFFQELASSPESDPYRFTAALHAAKRRTRETSQRTHPYFWAPFILIGLR